MAGKVHIQQTTPTFSWTRQALLRLTVACLVTAEQRAASIPTCESLSEDGTCVAETAPPSKPQTFFVEVDEFEEKTEPSVLPGDLSGKWWNREGGLSFKSKHMLQITTHNFNATVTDLKRPRMLIAFYDPRSESLKALREDLDRTADELARLQESGEVLGYLGACDTTVQTYLGIQEASELQSGWQQNVKASASLTFRFGRPRHFPIILVFYRDGKRMFEYTGVVNPKHIVKFLRLQKRKIGGSNVSDDKKFSKFLKGAGPIMMSCGLLNGTLEQEAFNKTATDHHGRVAFGIAPLDVCAKGLQRVLDAPQVVWIRGEGADLSSERNIHLANLSVASNATLLGSWLSSFKADILEEITPDNSHTFLEPDSPPLAVVLIDTKDTAARSKAEDMFEPVEQELRPHFNLVWASCAEFASQFYVPQKECPTVLVVDAVSMDFAKNSLKNLSKSAVNGSESSTLLTWMLETQAYRLAKARSKAVDDYIAARKNSSENVTSNSTSNSERSDAWKNRVVNETGKYEDQIQHVFLPKDWNGNLHNGFQRYHSLLSTLSVLRHSCNQKYSHLPLDFSLMDNAQGLHHSMRQLVKTEGDVLARLQNNTRLVWLWGAIESRSDFVYRMASQNFTNIKAADFKGKNEDLDDFPTKLLKGSEMLIKLFRKLLTTLHQRVENGTLGIPKAVPREIPRRDASELSVKEFFEEYARPAMPVIITGLNITDGDPWTLDFLKKRCFNKTVPLRKFEENMQAWGRLRDAGVLPIQDFIDTFTTNETRREWYLHDWSLPRFCPEVFGPAPFSDFTMPRYFAGDYFQRAGFEGYQHSWPSLFIGSDQTQSKMHIDSGNTNFWLHLLSGQKEWRIYPRSEMVNLYADVLGSHFWFDALEPDMERFPLAEYAEVQQAVQKAGELIFIPGGNPHAVRNLEAIHGISMNYADASNVGRFVLDKIEQEDWSTVEWFTDGHTIPSGLRSDQEPLTFGEWKSVQWLKLKYDLHSQRYSSRPATM